MALAEVDVEDMGETPHTPRRFVDRQIPVGVMVVLFLNLLAGVWFASSYASNVHQNTGDIVEMKEHDHMVDDQIVDIKTSLAVLKDRSKDSQDTAHRIEDFLRSPPTRQDYNRR